VRFLVKPFDVLDLFAAIDEALRRDQETMVGRSDA
jgi:DNA-binding response OmpR family regulator